MKCKECKSLVKLKSYGEPDYTCPKVEDKTMKAAALVAKVLFEGEILECEEWAQPDSFF